MNSNVSSVDSDDVSESLDDWEVLEFVSIENNLCWFLHVRWVDNFKDTFEEFTFSVSLGELMREACVNDNTVEVVDIIGL